MKINKNTLQGLLVFHVLAYSFFFLLTSSTLQVLAHSVADWIMIDCGARENYTDPNTNSSYIADDNRIVEYGEAHDVLSNYTKEQIGNQLKTLRSFPKGKRNCYTLPITPGNEDTHYLVRAFFAYGNYDDKRTIPSFDLYIGVDKWETFNREDGDIVRFEIIHVSPTADDELIVCLVNTGHGTPFISSLEVFPWQNSRYDQTASSSLTLMSRSKLGMSEDDATYIRYVDDIYGRSWYNRKMENSVRISTSSMAIDSDASENTYKLPKEVLSSAVKSVDASSSLVINMTYNTSYDHYVYLHFYDFENKSQNHQQRKMVIKFSDGIDVSFALEHMKPTTLVRNIKSGDGISTINITSDSQLPAILNAYEIFRVLPQPTINTPTDEGDVAAIRDLKGAYGIKRISWQGDPCRPVNYRWEGLTCSNNGTPRITSINLRSSNLSGVIASSFSNFTELRVLDLSNNNLTGEIPESLADEKNLNDINLAGNKLRGPIPQRLMDKENTGKLSLRTDNNKTEQGSGKGKKIRVIVGGTVGGAAAMSGLALTLKLGLRFDLCRRRSQQGRNDVEERRPGKKKNKKKEDESKDKNNKESTVTVGVKPSIPESLFDKASDAIQ